MSRTQKISLLIALYFAQGLPFGFFTIALPVMLRQSGQSLKAISLVSVLLTLPWLLKFLWAPFIDHRGTRRGWLLTLQLSAVAVAIVITELHVTGNYVLLFAAAFIFNVIAATQDIATDGLAVRMLDARELGLANGIQVGAYRVGMMFGGGLMIKIFELSGWSLAFGCMAALLAATIVPVLMMREPARAADEARASAIQLSFGWLRRLLTRGILLLAALIFCYRFGDQLLTTLLVPFLTDRGLGLSGIALLKGWMGNAMSIVGALLGGWLAFTTSRRRRPVVGGDDRGRRARHDGHCRAVRADDGCLGPRACGNRLHAACVRRAHRRHDRELLRRSAGGRVRLRDCVRDRRNSGAGRLLDAGLGAGSLSVLGTRHARVAHAEPAAPGYTIADFGN